MLMTKEIFIPLDAEGPFEHIKAQQCSSDSLIVKVVLLYKNRPVILDKDMIPQVVYQKPDGKKVVNDCEVDGQYLIVKYTKQMLIAAGTAKAQIYYSEDNQEIVSSAWYTDIYPTVGGQIEESSDEYITLSNFVKKASNSATAAANSAESASDSASEAEYYYEQAKRISESFAGALRPMGTVTFSALPSISQATEGDMYNISNQFTTTSSFKEGVGKLIPAGSNVYKTHDGFWDVLAGSPVSGVKGNKETTFRTGNVNITPDDIGLDKVDNTSDADKPISTATQKALDELNSNLYNEDSYTVELINNSNYTIVGNGIKEYIRNGISTVVVGALRCTTPANSWVHCATLKSKPLSELYFNLLTWEDTNPYKINCKIDVEGKVYFRYGVATTGTGTGTGIHYYGTVTFS